MALRFQFRLRTLMIVVTLFCVAGGWFGDEFRRAMNRKEVQREIHTSYGYSVSFVRRQHPRMGID
jgi:hypothetical protein